MSNGVESKKAYAFGFGRSEMINFSRSGDTNQLATGRITDEYVPVHVLRGYAVVNIFAGNEYGSFFVTEKPYQILWYGVHFKPVKMDGIRGAVKDIVSADSIAFVLESMMFGNMFIGSEW